MDDEVLDVCSVAVSVLKEKGIDVRGTRIDRLSGKDGTIIRLMPPRTLATYMDGSSRVMLTLQVIAKRLDALEAMAAADEAARALRQSDLTSANGSYTAVTQPEADGDLEELTIGTDGRSVWSARVRMQAIRN